MTLQGITEHVSIQIENAKFFLKQSSTGLNLEFSFFLTRCHTKVKRQSLSNYLPRAGKRIDGFISFPKVLAPCGMQTSSPGI